MSGVTADQTATHIAMSPRRILAIMLIIATGVLAALQLAKIAPLVGWYQQEIGLSLVAIGWLTALIGIFIALVALPTGWVIDRIGTITSVRLGAITLAAGAFGLALSREPALILTFRLIEALGYLALCVGLPALLNELSPARWKGPVLAVWSGFVPLGFAVSDLLARTWLVLTSSQDFLMAAALLLAATALVSDRVCAGLERLSAKRTPASLWHGVSAPVMLLALAFCVFVILSISFFAFLPNYLQTASGRVLLVSAGAIALLVPLGNLLAGMLVAGRSVRIMVILGTLGFLLSAASAWLVFAGLFAPVATMAAAVYAISGAVVASILFAVIPYLVAPSGSVPMAMGLVAQGGGIGTVIGPPVSAAVIENFGYAGLGLMLSALAMSGFAILLPLVTTRRHVAT